jgi:hypothetical protein
MKLLRPTLLFLFLPALATAAPAPLARESRRAEPGGWSKPVDGLRVRLIAPQTRYRVGDTVRLVLEIQNVSGSALAFEEPYLGWSISDRAAAGWSITCERHGRNACPREAFKELKRLSEWRKLPAGRTLRVEITAKAELEEKKLERARGEDESCHQELSFPDGDTAGVCVLRARFTPEQERRREVIRGGWGANSLVSPPVRIELEK